MQGGVAVQARRQGAYRVGSIVQSYVAAGTDGQRSGGDAAGLDHWARRAQGQSSKLGRRSDVTDKGNATNTGRIDFQLAGRVQCVHRAVECHRAAADGNRCVTQADVVVVSLGPRRIDIGTIDHGAAG